MCLPLGVCVSVVASAIRIKHKKFVVGLKGGSSLLKLNFLFVS